ncbi:MAG: SpoIIE family protein phosphatase [Thermosediminibacteraceae bacterium]|nr:SpoIIE family protein phosphatase [Thermosediminibacteraceae bacterium]
MKVFTEVFARSLNKRGEELCGDSVEVVQSEDSIIAVMADGLGSGVKANILSTLTTRIASTMIRNKASIEEVVKTIANTLPVCRIRKIAYSTFSILEINDEGEGRLFEFDNPPVIYIRSGKVLELPRREFRVEDKKILEYNFKALAGDKIFIVSDGVIHAGVGGLLNLGWQWSNVANYLERVEKRGYYVSEMVERLIETCNHLYRGEPGDDATVVGVGVRESELTTVLVGPPEDKSKDAEVVKKLIASKGKKVVCGGTTANIVAREMGKEIITKLDYMDPAVPPTACIEGIDLVTEGLITLTKCLEMLRNMVNMYNFTLPLPKEIRKEKDGASKLVDLLVNRSTHISFMVGRAVNPAHRDVYFPGVAGDKVRIVEEIAQILKKCGKRVYIELY